MRRGFGEHEPQCGVLPEVFGGALAQSEGEDLGEEEKGGMNHEQLDRLLCERLDIKGTEVWAVSNGKHKLLCGSEDEAIACLIQNAEICKANGYTLKAHDFVFPKLSTTGEGMLVLMDALRAQGHSWVVEGDGYGLCRGKVQPEGWHHAILGERADSAPLALALAAAAALQRDRWPGAMDSRG